MSKIVWIDMEMTGLDLQKDRIMEIACLITDNNLNVTAEHPSIVIHQPDSLLDSMNQWCKTTHGKVLIKYLNSKFVHILVNAYPLQTGLSSECRNSKITEKQAEEMVLKFFGENGISPSSSPLAGNSVYMDRMFLKEYMPRIDTHLHYRIIDISTLKELCKRWNQSLFSNVPPKMLLHRGISDIKESIEELKFYKGYMFQSSK